MLARLMEGVRNRWHPLWRLRRLPAYRWFQQRYDVTLYSRIPDTGIRVAVKGLRDASWIANPTRIEPEIRSAFALVLKNLKPRVFWDVGANIGFYSWWLRRDPSVQDVVMFEPDPTNFALIMRTIRENGIADCRPLNIALSDRCGQANFLVDRASGATGALEAASQAANETSLHHDYGMGETIVCELATIDSLIAGGVAEPSLLKIDVEGAEDLVLAGAASFLAKSSPALIIETTNANVVQRLRDTGYRAFNINAGNWLFVPGIAGIDLTPFTQAFAEALPARADGRGGRT